MMRQPVVAAALILGISLMLSALILREPLRDIAGSLNHNLTQLGSSIERAGRSAGQN